MVTTPNSNIRIGELNVLLARNFKETHDALRGKRRVDPATKDSVKSMRMTNGIRLSKYLTATKMDNTVFLSAMWKVI